MPFFKHDGLDFHYRERDDGKPFIFQHGLGGNVDQPFGLIRPQLGSHHLPPPLSDEDEKKSRKAFEELLRAAIAEKKLPAMDEDQIRSAYDELPSREYQHYRLLAFDCRGHGETRPLGDPEKIGFQTFVDDLLAFMDFLQLRQAIIGGISMGAALALAFTLRYPERVERLVLSRPAWLAGPMIDNARIYAEIARLIREKGPVEGQAIFRQSEMYQAVLQESPDAAESLLGQFSVPRTAETAVKLERIPQDTPLDDLVDLREIKVPTLVLANRQDPIHPFAYGETLARLIRGARFLELTPKSVSKERQAEDVNSAITEFLTEAQS